METRRSIQGKNGAKNNHNTSPGSVDTQKHQKDPLITSPPILKSSTEETTGLVPGKSFADALNASLRNSNTSMSIDHITTVDDHESDASQTNLETVSIESPRTKDRPTEKVPLKIKEKKKK